MKALQLMKVIICLGSILLFGIFLNSCKRNSLSTKEVERAELLNVYKEKLKNESFGFAQQLNKKGKGYYGDLNGNIITKSLGIVNRGATTSCPETGESEFEQEFVSMWNEYTCNVGYRFNITYKITSEFSPIMQLSSTQYSFGRIRMKNSGGTVIYTTPQADRSKLLSIVDGGVVGQNSYGADLHEFTINFRTEYISESVFQNAATIEPLLFIYTDCANYPTQQISFTPQQSASGTQQYNQPCARVDKVYWNPSNNPTPPSLSGADPCLCFGGCLPYGYTFPDKQVIEFKNSDNDWKPFYLYVNGMGNPSLERGEINYWDVFYIDVSTTVSQNKLVIGWVQVRYRNKCGSSYTLPLDTYAYASWYID